MSSAKSKPANPSLQIQACKSKPVKSTPAKILKHYRIDAPARFRLASVDCADTGNLDKDTAVSVLAEDVKRLSDLQARLYARSQWAVLIVLQGMDAAGKDSVVA